VVNKKLLVKPITFEWDQGNNLKNWEKHKVGIDECEQVFFNKPLRIYPDQKHSKIEQRFTAYGRTNDDRKLTVVFTFRNRLIRIISARDQNKNEKTKYEQK